MKFLVSQEHINFFQHHQFVEFEDLLSDSETDNLKRELESTLKKRCKMEVNHCTPVQLYMAGRDLRKDSPVIEKLASSRKFGEIASSLFQVKPLRLAYDQFLGTFQQTGAYPFTSFTLEEMSSIQKIQGGLILALSDSAKENPPYPSKKNSGTFLHPQKEILLNRILDTPNQQFLLIVYCSDRSIYVLHKADPHTHSLKKMGYGFGDHLHGEHHPLVFH